MNLNHILHLLAISSSLAFTSVNHAMLHASQSSPFSLKLSSEVTDGTSEDDMKVCLITGSSQGMYLLCLPFVSFTILITHCSGHS